MKSTGIVKKIDELGRLVLPSETRKVMGMNSGDSVEIFVDGNRIILKRYEPGCIFCGEADDVVVYMEKRICRECAEKLNKQVN